MRKFAARTKQPTEVLLRPRFAPRRLLPLLCAAFVEVAAAGNWASFKGSVMEWLDDEDIRLLMAAVDAVVSDAATPAERQWRNEQTGHYGELRTLSAFAGPNGIRCKRLRVVNHAGSRQGKSTHTLCDMSPDGWRIVPADFASQQTPKP